METTHNTTDTIDTATGATNNGAGAEQLLEYYRAIEQVSAKMLEAAQRGDWDAVVRGEGSCTVLIEQLRCAARQQEHELPRPLRREKARIMQRILRNDAHIRLFTEPWLDEVEQLLGGRGSSLH